MVNYLYMRSAEFVPFLLTEKADIFSIRLNGNVRTETEEFLIEYKDTASLPLKKGLDFILASISGIGNEGALESFFRPEGNFSDRVCAMPLWTPPRRKDKCGTLRLYCIRMSDSLLIIGGGGEKKTRTYEEDSALLEKVRTLQSIDKVLADMEEDGVDVASAVYNLTIEIK